jgi:sulfate/thiosulfate transport system substrate-binding protein
VKPRTRRGLRVFIPCLVLAVLALMGATSAGAETKLLNVSYDVTREYYKEIDAAFIAHWKATTGETITVSQSHGGSSQQAHAVVDGLEADVITMNQAPDIDLLASAGNLLPADWAARLPDHSAPTTSTILFLVRRGNPKGIRDWSDLAKPGIAVIVPNPKTSGNGRYSYLAAWGYARRQPGGSDATARAFVGKLFGNVPVLDTGGRGATTTFALHGLGDVLLTFESEVALIQEQFPAESFAVVVPSCSILAENPVAWVDHYVERHGTQRAARAYLDFLYSDEGQEIAARHHYRPRSPAVLARHAADFPSLPLFTVEFAVGGWAEARRVHFADGGVFDQIYTN